MLPSLEATGMKRDDKKKYFGHHVPRRSKLEVTLFAYSRSTIQDLWTVNLQLAPVQNTKVPNCQECTSKAFFQRQVKGNAQKIETFAKRYQMTKFLFRAGFQKKIHSASKRLPRLKIVSIELTIVLILSCRTKNSASHLSQTRNSGLMVSPPVKGL